MELETEIDDHCGNVKLHIAAYCTDDRAIRTIMTKSKGYCIDSRHPQRSYKLYTWLFLWHLAADKYRLYSVPKQSPLQCQDYCHVASHCSILTLICAGRYNETVTRNISAIIAHLLTRHRYSCYFARWSHFTMWNESIEFVQCSGSDINPLPILDGSIRPHHKRRRGLSNVFARWRQSILPSNTWLIGPTKTQHPKQHLDRFSRFCRDSRSWPSQTNRQTDRGAANNKKPSCRWGTARRGRASWNVNVNVNSRFIGYSA